MSFKDNIKIILKVIVFGSIVYVNSKMNKDVQAQATTPVDSLDIGFGKMSAGYKTRYVVTPTWEWNNGKPQVRKEIDIGRQYISKNEGDLPQVVSESNFGVTGTGVRYDTVLVKGEVYSFADSTALEDIGVNIDAYYNNGFDKKFLGGNYLEPRVIKTDEEGKFYMPVLMPVYANNITITGIKTETIDDKIPDNFELYQNYPNPFNLRTTIKYDLDKPASDVELIIYNQLGEQILKKEMPSNAGSYNIHWDGESESGATLPSGVYFYNLKVDDKRETKCMILLK